MSTIVLATDLTDGSDAVAAQAVDLATRLPGRLLVLHVVDLGGPSGRGRSVRVDQARALREPRLVELVRSARALGVDAEFLLWFGVPAETIVDAAASEGAELIVIGTQGSRQAGRSGLGPVADSLLRIARVPVLVVPRDRQVGPS